MAEAADAAFNTWLWGDDRRKPRLLHTMVRVEDFDRALRFYVEGFGMKVLDRFEVESRRASAIYIGFGDYDDGGVLELVRYWGDKGAYTHGTGYGHIAVGVPDVAATVANLEAIGAEVALRPKALMDGGPAVAFVKDPDGYSIEIIQTLKG
jgi:lactoylglutathione lyase